jgi:hypothetical protein
VDSKIDKIEKRAEAVAVLTDDERLSNRRKSHRVKLDQAATDPNDAIERVIEKATRAAKELSKK